MTCRFRRWALVAGIVAILPLHSADPDLRVSDAEARKAAIVKPAPDYPLAARQLKVSGKVEIEAVVSDAGVVEEIRSTTGNAMLTRAASDAVKKWKFTPFASAGKPVRALVSLSFEFTSR